MSIENTNLYKGLKKGEVKKVVVSSPFDEPQVQEQAQAPIQEEPKPQAQEPINTQKWEKQEYRNLTIRLNCRHIGYIKALCERQDKREKALVEQIFEEYFKNQNFGEDIEKRARELTPKGQ